MRTPSTNGLRLTSILLLAGLAGCPDPPPPSRVQVPRLELGRMTWRAVTRAYGPPRVRTAEQMWYCGPDDTALPERRDGWMTVLRFDDQGRLVGQEYLRRAFEQGYLRVDYEIRGRLADRDRDGDFDRLLMAQCEELARQDSNYRLTSRQDRLFVLARMLPGGNEPVARWELNEAADKSRVTLVVKALPGRDEPLMDKVDGAIRRRISLIDARGDGGEEPQPPGLRP